MSDEENGIAVLGAVGTLAAFAALGPVAGVTAAIASHAITSMSIDSGWRRANLDLWAEILTEWNEERREQYKATQDEFTRHRIVSDWLKDELANLSERVEILEVTVAGLLQTSDALLRHRSDLEMRPFLLNIWRNRVRRPDEFNGTWMARCFSLLEKLGADHLHLLCAFMGYAYRDRDGRRTIRFPNGGAYEQFFIMNADFAIARDELDALELLGSPRRWDGAGTMPFVMQPTAMTWKLIELVSPAPLQFSDDR